MESSTEATPKFRFRRTITDGYHVWSGAQYIGYIGKDDDTYNPWRVAIFREGRSRAFVHTFETRRAAAAHLVSIATPERLAGLQEPAADEFDF